MEVIVFIILVTFCSETCCSTRLFEDGQIWGGKGVGRPAKVKTLIVKYQKIYLNLFLKHFKVIIDEIITRSITFPAPKARQTNDRSTFGQNRWGEGFNGKRYGQEQFYQQSPQLLTPNRRQEDNSNTENSLQFDGKITFFYNYLGNPEYQKYFIFLIVMDNQASNENEKSFIEHLSKIFL